MRAKRHGLSRPRGHSFPVPRGQNQGYPAAGDPAPAGRLHAALPGLRGAAPVQVWSGGASDAERLFRIDGATLHIAPFRIDRWGQRYISHGQIRVDLAALTSSLYRIVAVHDFRVEDRNPDLDECPAGVFLARQCEGRWEEAEDHPVECRSVAVLGHLDVAARRIAPP